MDRDEVKVRLTMDIWTSKQKEQINSGGIDRLH